MSASTRACDSSPDGFDASWEEKLEDGRVWEGRVSVLFRGCRTHTGEIEHVRGVRRDPNSKFRFDERRMHR